MVVGVLVFFLGLASKLILDLDELRDGDADEKSKAWFRFFTCGPDLTIFALSLFLAVDAIKHVLAAGKFNNAAAACYSYFLIASIIALLLNYALFHLGGKNKKIPLAVFKVSHGGPLILVKARLDLKQIFLSNECFCVLVIGNILGLFSLGSFAYYISQF
ncbi:hypothetical protein [Rhodopirellula europaea]|uniref:hypothetical protein n=1 Tax=Rhodopirellula europaea TaxID=1263866 RepID=UPI0030EEF089